MIIADLIAPLLPWIIGAFGILAAVVSAWFGGQARGKDKANSDAKDEDYENADDIRRRVSTDRAKRVRELDGQGWRD